MTLHVRVASESDLPRIMEIAASTPLSAQWSADEYAKFFSSKIFTLESSSSTDARAKVSASKSVQDRAILVAEDANALVGFIVGRGVAGDWEIENIAVIPWSQKRGVGRLLLTEFLLFVRERGGSNVFLEVRESNHRARLLYEKAGFAEVGRRKSYYHAPPEDAAVLKISFS